ncbi:MAG: dTMP kinase [Hyphomonadaceae bacterium]|nr:MAG: tmk [Caulobacteraceae bacterium]MBT9445121.1 dTMP kinase [Hyphomonadaceae bacterium]TPW08445.1 MAG: tmk [Alphaproteobacteria bacterium]
MSRPRFITLEGGEGVGKSTLAAGLEEAINRIGQTVVRTREPGGSVGADEIRKLIVTGAGDRWSGVTETLLLTAARSDHLERTIRPAIERGDWVICDRFIDSTFAYQVVARGLPYETFVALNKVVAAPTPDLTLILDLDVKTGLARALNRRGGEARFETLDEAFHNNVRQAFRDVAAREPERCAVIDAGQPPELVLRQACALVSARLGLTL